MGADPAQPRPASTLALLRDRVEGGIEVFMVRRHSKSTFMPDVFVFPGGSVSPEDCEVEDDRALCTAPNGTGQFAGAGFHIAAIRECFEECGVLLARKEQSVPIVGASTVAELATYRTRLQRGEQVLASMLYAYGLQAACEVLVHWAHWVTPESLPVRFDAHFFLARMPENQVAEHDKLETTGERWIRPEDALEMHAQGKFPLVIATEKQLEALCDLRSVTDAIRRFEGVQVRTVRPRIAKTADREVVELDDYREPR